MLASKGTRPRRSPFGNGRAYPPGLHYPTDHPPDFARWSAGAAAAIAWAVSREITQAEYRWIEHYGGHLRANMPWWGGLDPRVWQYADPWLDWIAPTVAVVAVATIASRWDRRAS